MKDTRHQPTLQEVVEATIQDIGRDGAVAGDWEICNALVGAVRRRNWRVDLVDFLCGLVDSTLEESPRFVRAPLEVDPGQEAWLVEGSPAHKAAESQEEEE